MMPDDAVLTGGLTGTAARVRKHRLSLRAAGLRPVQIWVHDTRSAAFVAECRRQSLLAAAATRSEAAVHGWLEQVADTEGWQ